MIARDYSDKDLRAALGSSPPLEKMKMGHTPNDGLARLLDALAGDCFSTPDWEEGGETCERAAAALRAKSTLITELVGALEGIKRLAKDRNFTSVNFQLNAIEIATDDALAKAKVQP